MIENLNICPLSETSIPFVVQLAALCLAGEKITENTIKDAMSYPHNFIFVAKIQNEVVGFIDYSIVLDDAYLNNIAVSPLYRHKKIASALMDQMISNCVKNHAKSISLEARKSNISAIGLYLNFGFIKVGFRHKIYSKPTEDGIVMKKTICI